MVKAIEHFLVIMSLLLLPLTLLRYREKATRGASPPVTLKPADQTSNADQ